MCGTNDSTTVIGESSTYVDICCKYYLWMIILQYSMIYNVNIAIIETERLEIIIMLSIYNKPCRIRFIWSLLLLTNQMKKAVF